MRCSSSCFDEDTAGLRPGPVLDPRPQERVLQHTVEHEDAICLFVQILDALVPQLGEQLVHFFRSLDTQLPVEQVIHVPKISDDSIQPRLVDRDLRFPKLEEQLVEVPTILSFASLQQQTVERGLCGRGGGGLHGFLPGQSYSLSSEHIVDNPVHRVGGGGGLQGFHQGQNPAAFVEQNVDNPVPGRGLQNFRSGQGSTASSAVQPGKPFQWFFFLTFHRNKKKVRGSPTGHCGSRRGHQLMDAGGL